MSNSYDVIVVGVQRGVHGDDGPLDGREITLEQDTVETHARDRSGCVIAK